MMLNNYNLDRIAKLELLRKHKRDLTLRSRRRLDILGINQLSGFGSGGIAGDDPYWSNVVYACHMDGTNGANTFTDERGHTITANGNVITSSTQSKFGGTSAYHDGAGDYTSATLTAAEYFDYTNAFTVDFWSYPQLASGTDAIVSYGNYTKSGSFGNGFYIGVETAQVVVFFYKADGGVAAGSLAYAADIRSAWNFIELSSDGTTIKLFVGGTERDSEPAANCNFAPSSTSEGHIRTGVFNSTYSNEYLGYVDDLRVTRGVARNTTNYSVPTAAFPNS